LNRIFKRKIITLVVKKKREKIRSAKGGAEPQPTEEKIVSVVSIGASAGGLEAFSEILRHLPIQTGLAFVFVQHLDPHHSSQLVPILTRETALPIKRGH
jgi:two-component system CheB/CheR fusion protein